LPLLQPFSPQHLPLLRRSQRRPTYCRRRWLGHWRQRRSVSTVQPILLAIEVIASHSEP
jgi:hypothetical protein